MQKEIVEPPNNFLLSQIIHINNVSIINAFLSFLQPSEIQIIAAFSFKKQRTERIFLIAHAKHFLNRYVNRVDRTNYFLFYDQAAFKKIEQQQITHIALHEPERLAYHHKQIESIIRHLSEEIKQLPLHEELQAIIASILFQTDLPLPKMKRETIGMNCQSNFQDFLALLRFSEDIAEEQWQEEAVLELKERIQIELQYQLTNFPYEHYPTSAVHQIIKNIRFAGYKVQSTNLQQFKINGFKMHNLIVILLTLCSELVDCYGFILEKYTDPFMFFTEFVLRSNVYRNIVLSLEEKFGFLFSSYSLFYEKIYLPEDKPKFSFWRAAMSIWLQKMKIYHHKNSKIFSYIAIKIREKFLYDFLLIKTQKLPSFFTTLKDQIFLKIFSESHKQQIYSQENCRFELQQFFQKNEDLYEIILKDYLQYMIDVSIDQFSVHKCGHSEHSVSKLPLFQQFQQALISQSISLYLFCRQILYDSVPKQIRLGMIKEVIKEDLQIMYDKICKPVTMKHLLVKINQLISEEINEMPEYVVFAEEGYAKYKIGWDFDEKDSLLDYFCNKYGIKECPKGQQFYYCFQLQSKSIDNSLDSDCQQQINELQKYDSEQEGDMSDGHH